MFPFVSFQKLKSAIMSLATQFGYNISKRKSIKAEILELVPEIKEYDLETIVIAKSISMQSIERLWSVVSAVKYVCANNIPGDFVECGVFLGGSGVAIGRTLDKYFPEQNRRILLFDTYEGMVEPGEFDYKANSDIHSSSFLSSNTKEDGKFNVWAYASEESVKHNLETLQNYPMDNFNLVKGDVARTLVQNDIKSVAFLRLDTDWYDSTKIELEVLWPKLSMGGVLIVDDVGHWAGARKAFEDFFQEDQKRLVHRIDSTGRLLVK